MTIDEAVEQAFKARDGKEIEDQAGVREVLLTEIERLEELTSFEARFCVPIIQGLADDLYRPNLGNAAID
jgi:hypothetical protein